MPIHEKFTLVSKLARNSLHLEDLMTEKGKHVAIQLTQEQKAHVKAVTGKDAETVELSVEELEERIAPSKQSVKPIIGGRA